MCYQHRYQYGQGIGVGVCGDQGSKDWASFKTTLRESAHGAVHARRQRGPEDVVCTDRAATRTGIWIPVSSRCGLRNRKKDLVAFLKALNGEGGNTPRLGSVSEVGGNTRFCRGDAERGGTQSFVPRRTDPGIVVEL
jgi:hypothetical protein